MSVLIEEVERFVRSFFFENMPDSYTFHSIGHTEQVVEACKTLAYGLSLPAHQLETLLIAAWFHDTGYLDGRNDHEQRSAKVAEQFLTERNMDGRQIGTILNCIMSTKVPQNPNSELEKLLCDADLSGLGALDYELRSENLRLERELMDGKAFQKLDWLRSEVKFYENHSYFTDTANALYGVQKQRNYDLLVGRVQRLESV